MDKNNNFRINKEKNRNYKYSVNTEVEIALKTTQDDKHKILRLIVYRTIKKKSG